MLDQKTKRSIDAARQVLVGKIPDPKAQVEQITTALIYKFMDDMDRQNEELGGKAKFLTGELKKFRWGNLISKELSGHERLDLYTRALSEFSKSKRIPPLFQQIFKDSFLPYRDAETLNLFLKEINVFTYDHSENLGNAFEYLLSVLGSQGEAGQFRTPRHIIDFIVEVVKPNKTEKILDPACGTAGFLISSYKHIRRQNSSNFKGKDYQPSFARSETKDVALVEIQGDGKYKGDKLSPDDRKKLGRNIIGYDISPDMVKLSLVNMYLHGFNTPLIFEYDTLTYEDRWDDYFDVILANPPFMSPKGGIRPHKRFQIQANRSELLFVDYIAEHLTINGRAGVIVPEGIIFQSSNAYKNLRKWLIEDNYLWAVLSLPAGVFKPYSGVKTSILFLDRERAKKNDEILFVKVNNDGFDLGDQRRAINRNDLPEVFSILLAWQKGNKPKSTFAIWVNKDKILENGDCNLTSDRYRETIEFTKAKWPMVNFTEISTLEYGVSLPKKIRKEGNYPVVGSNGITGWHNEFLITGPVIVVGRKGSAGEVTWIEQNCFPIDTTYFVKLNNDNVNLKFLYYILKSLDLSQLRGGAGIPGLNRNDVYEKHKIPLPPLEVQQEIGAELDGYQCVIDGARQVVENWKPSIKSKPDWELIRLGDVSGFIGGYAFKSSNLKKRKESNNYLPVIKIGNLKKDGTLETINSEYHRYTDSLKRFIIKVDDVLIAMTGATVGKVAASDSDNLLLNQRVGLVRAIPTKIHQRILKWTLINNQFYTFCQRTAGGGAQGNISPTQIKNYEFRIPPRSEQNKIISKIEAEQKAVNAAKQLIEIHEQKIKDRIAEVWGE